jgi:hypothetical protein
MFYLLEFIGEHSPSTWKVELSDEPTVEADEKVLNNLCKSSLIKRLGPLQLYRPKKITIKFLSPFPDDRCVYKRKVLTEKFNPKSRICDESSEPFVKLYWTFSYFNDRGLSPMYKPDFMIYKMKKNWTVDCKWHMKNVNVISFSIESSIMPSVENCSMDIIPESFWLI